MSYIFEKTIQSYIDEERTRTVKLARKVSGGLLIFCIENAYSVAELPTARQRYEESKGDEDAEDLM